MTNMFYEGGIRCNGVNKNSSTSALVSIITVVFNDVLHIEATIQSVLAQNYEHVEFIIVDGGSTDGTLDVIKKYENKIDYWVSERDDGIYYAMNRGIDLVSGEWINFMNSGDSFYNSSVIKNTFNYEKNNDVDVIFGHHNVIYPYKKNIVVKAGDAKLLWKGSQFCHQSSFIKSSLHKINKFNALHRIGADFEFFYNAYKNNKHFKYKDIVVSTVSAGGLSDIKRVDSIVGRWNVIEKTHKVNFYYICLVLNEMIKMHVKKIVKLWR
jgi:glycosyltransferase involved in cell wall biosynthesis